MDGILESLNKGFEDTALSISEFDQNIIAAEARFVAIFEKAKLALEQHPKNAKRFNRIIESSDEESKQANLENQSLRPTRTAKSKATQHLKEANCLTKMRNDNNTIIIKTERVRSSSINKSVKVPSPVVILKENIPDPIVITQTTETTDIPLKQKSKRNSPDEGIQSACEADLVIKKSSSRSNSIEIINIKPPVEIDITVKKSRTKQKAQPTSDSSEIASVISTEVVREPLRITRSKIKQEKPSIGGLVEKIINDNTVAEVTLSTKSSNETVTKEKKKKKYPMPILIKLEPEVTEDPPIADSQANDTFNVPAIANETITITPALNETITVVTRSSLNENNPNTTVTIERNAHESLMTEDNDDDEQSAQEPQMAPPLTKKMPKLLQKTEMLLKKNEVFNPYLQSPVKKKVEAFEKHAVQNINTPDKAGASKYHTLKAGTPSKIAVAFGKTTPLNTKVCGTGTIPKITSASTTKLKPQKSKLAATKSLSQESLDDLKKTNSINVLLEEKRKQREEKQKMALIHREQLDKEKREQAQKVAKEREDRFKKLMQEKEERLRMEALKKKIMKEKQEKKFAEVKKDEFAIPKPVDQSERGVNLNDSLHLKLQKQLLLDKTEQQRRAEAKHIYTFDSLDTDDSTDDESRPSKKRAPPPDWSNKKNRKNEIEMQSYVNSNVIDALFSVQPISVDLKLIFPGIDSKKLVRNSSAIWSTPPRYSQMPKY
ncbi:unnamed protein product [Diamesa serratosioi]